YLAADAEVAGAHLAQRAVEIGKHRIEKALAQRRRMRLFALQPMEVKEGVQTDQLESAVDRIRHPALDKKAGLAGMLHNAAVGKLGSLANGKGSEHREHYERSRCNLAQ